MWAFYTQLSAELRIFQVNRKEVAEPFPNLIEPFNAHNTHIPSTQQTQLLTAKTLQPLMQTAAEVKGHSARAAFSVGGVGARSTA